ncbi:hypothetical protein D3C72_1739410 [compost metagenome]|jgi:hypothetical protein
MSLRVIGPCHVCGTDVRADERRDAATIPILERAAKAGRLTCKPCAAEGVTGVDRDNPPDVKVKQ